MHTDMKLFTFIASSHKSETHLIKNVKKATISIRKIKTLKKLLFHTFHF